MKKLTLVLLFCFVSAGYCAERYVSLAPSTTEILFALGLDEGIVGVSSFCGYPEAAKTKQKVGDFSHPNIEMIVALRPDHIFCTGLEQAPVIAALQRLGLKVYVADPQSLEGLLATISDIGRITGRDSRAASLIAEMRAECDAVRKKVEQRGPKERPRVFIEIWHDPLSSAGKGSFVDEVIAIAGGINVAADAPRPYSAISPEAVIAADPQCIILAYMDEKTPLEIVTGRFGWQGVSAVKNGRVFNDIDPDILLRPGPRITEGVRKLYERLYP